MKKKPMARKWEDVRRDKRCKFIEDALWSLGAVAWHLPTSDLRTDFRMFAAENGDY